MSTLILINVCIVACVLIVVVAKTDFNKIHPLAQLVILITIVTTAAIVVIGAFMYYVVLN